MERNRKNEIWEFCNSLRKYVPYSNIYENTIKLLFIKYMVTYPDNLAAKSSNPLEVYKCLIEFSRRYSSARMGSGKIQQNDLYNVLKTLDETQNADNKTIRLVDMCDSILFFFDERTQRLIIELLDNFDLSDNPEVIKDQLDMLSTNIIGDGRKTGESISSYPLRKLASRLLETNDMDKYIDCFCGYSTSLINIDQFDEYVGYELNTDAAVISKLTSILLNKKKVSIVNDDFLYIDTKNIADKVLSDGPIGLKRDIPWLVEQYNVSTKDIDILSVYKVVDTLKDGGRAVIVVPGKILFSTSKTGIELREMLLSTGLKSVVSLPPLWIYTNSPTNILVVEKGYQGNVLFINAYSNDKDKKNKRGTAILPEDIDKITNSIQDMIEIEGFSKLVNLNDLAEDKNLVPTTYIKYVDVKSRRTVKEIDKELSILYEQLTKSIN